MGGMFPDKKLCMFDFDGTLVDSMGAFADIAADVVWRHYGMPRDEAREKYLLTSGIPFFQQLEIIFPGRTRNSVLADEFEARKLEGFFEEPYFPDVRDTVGHLRSRGIKTAVSSNNFQYNVDRFVSRRPVPFDYVLGFREGFAKGKDHFDFVMQRENLSSGDILFVGDSLKDAERALSCGVDFVGKAGTFTREQFIKRFPGVPVVQCLSEVPGLL